MIGAAYGTTAYGETTLATTSVVSTAGAIGDAPIGVLPISGSTTTTVAGTVSALAALAASSTLTAAGSIPPQGAAALSAVSTLTTTALVDQPAAASLTASSTLTSAGIDTKFGAASLTTTSTLTADATVGVIVSLAAVSTLTVTGFATLATAAALSVSSTLASTALGVVPGAAGLTAVGSLTVTGFVTETGAAALSASSTLTATVTPFAANLVAVSSLADAAMMTAVSAAALSTSSSLVVTFVYFAAAGLTASSTLTTSGSRTYTGAASLTARDTLTVVTPSSTTFGAAALASRATLSSDVYGQTATVALVSTATLTDSSAYLRGLPHSTLSMTFTGPSTAPVRLPSGTGLNPITFTVGLSGHGEVAVTSTPVPAGLDLRVVAGVSLALPEPAFIQGQPLIPDYWAKMSSSVTASGLLVVPDPDPILTVGGAPNPHPGGVAPAYTWHVSDLGTPDSSGYDLADWAPHGGVGPHWKSAGGYTPRVRKTVIYGTGNRYHTYTAGVHFDGANVEHMWLDWGSNLAQPFSVVICGIIHYYPTRTYGHYLLDAGKATPGTYADDDDHTFNEGLSYRSLMLYQSSTAVLATHTGADAVRDGKHVISRADFAPRPKMFFGVFNGTSSTIGAWDLRSKHASTGAIDAHTHRYFVMGRRQNNVSDNLASHMTVFEVRMFTQALSTSVLTEIFHQLASTWKFNLYHV